MINTWQGTKWLVEIIPAVYYLAYFTKYKGHVIIINSVWNLRNACSLLSDESADQLKTILIMLIRVMLCGAMTSYQGEYVNECTTNTDLEEPFVNHTRSLDITSAVQIGLKIGKYSSSPASNVSFSLSPLPLHTSNAAACCVFLSSEL